MVACVLDHGWTIEQTAERFQVDPKTVRKWRDRYLTEGDAGLQDRSSRPRHSPNQTPRAQRRRVVRLRKRCRWGADHIGHELGIAPSTVQAILRSEGLARLDRGDRATGTEPVRRYQRDRPGELVHVDVKKIAAIPSGGGWRMHGRGNAPAGDHSGAGYRYIHTAIDDRTRVAYSEIHDDEQAITAAGFWARAVDWFAGLGVIVERVLTDNGVTAGIDLALQLLRTHHGAEMAADAARNMVVYVKRSGGQQQFSAQLAAQSSTHPTIEDVCAYIVDNPSADLSVVALAERVAMSERSFQRLFSKEVGTSPAKFVERCRIDAGRRLLESTTDGLSTIARRCGFTSPETFLRAFKRLVGVNPTEYRQRFSA